MCSVPHRSDENYMRMPLFLELCMFSLTLSLSLCLSVCPSIGLSIGAHLLPLCASVYTSTSTKNDRVACGAYVVHKCSGAAAHVRSGASRIGAVMLTCVVVLGWGHIYIYPFLSSLAPGLLFRIRSMRWSLQGLCS